MPSTPYMGLSLPTPGLSVPDWANLLNTAFSLIDSHDHSAGHGLQVPSAGISINADLTFNGWNLTQARTLRLQGQAAAPALASDAGCLYLTTAGDLWWNNGAGQHVQITSGAALSAASLGGISGLGGTSAGVAFSNATKTFTFTQAANQSALLDAGPLVIHDTAASAFGITLQSPVGIAGAYALTLPTALPAANALLSIGTSGALTAFGTVSGADLTLAGNLKLNASGAGISQLASGSGLFIVGNQAAASAGADVALNGSATRTAGLLTQIQNNNTGKLDIDYQGLVRLTSQAAPLQPASIWTAITPNTGWFANGGAAYYKDATGRVHLKGWITRTTGTGAAFNLPAGFRASFTRTFGVATVAAGVPATVLIYGAPDPTPGDVFVDATSSTNPRYLDGISFLAEA